MRTPQELETIRNEALRSLDATTTLNRALLAAGKTRTCKWEEVSGGLKTKVGRGTLTVYKDNAGSYPGVRYTSSYGANSEDSYSGFIPCVTFDEALLLIWDKHQRQVNS